MVKWAFYFMFFSVLNLIHTVQPTFQMRMPPVQWTNICFYVFVYGCMNLQLCGWLNICSILEIGQVTWPNRHMGTGRFIFVHDDFNRASFKATNGSQTGADCCAVCSGLHIKSWNISFSFNVLRTSHTWIKIMLHKNSTSTPNQAARSGT